MSPNPPRPRPRGYVATGPSFYVWEERRGDAIRSARDLLIRPSATPVVVAPQSPRGRAR
jgi:hypothetical protein